MDHTCYKCGATVEEGAPFCPNCRAPLIRVHVPGEEREPDAPATAPFPPGTPEQVQPPAQRVPLNARVRLRDALGTASAASVVMIVSWLLVPAGLIFATAAAGGLAVLLYARRRPEVRLTAGSGARIGMVSGLVSLIFFVVAILYSYLADHGAGFRQMMEQLINMQANNPRKAEMLSSLNSPEFMATLVILLIVFLAVLLLGVSAIGGAVAAKLMRKKEPR